MDLPLEIAQASAEVQAHYKKMIAAGQSPRFAEMCALQIAPGVHGTDDSFMQGRKNAEWLDKIPKRQAQWMLREAKKAGISTEGRYYHGGIADSRAHLDPHAWISGKDDLLRVAKKRRLIVQGQVSYDPGDAPPPQRRKSLNPALVREMARKEMAAEPGLTMKAAKQRVVERHTPHFWKK
jgi:hypothetical protein